MRILHIDDNEQDITVVKHLLASVEDLEITPAQDARTTLHELVLGERELPDLILLDLNIPDMNGLEFLRIARASERLSNMAVIVVSSTQSEKEIKEVYTYGATDFVMKEYELKDYKSNLVDVITRFKSGNLQS